MLDFKEAIPLSVYIHLPWCVKKCPYCDFNSHEFSGSELNEQAYVDALIRDLDSELPRIWGRQVSSVFIGGGTPSLFSADALAQLLSALRSRLNLYPDIEITLEANPGTAEADKFQAFRELGINRLSIGIQSFHDPHLQALGRIHSAAEAEAAVEMAKAAGFERINLDLMFGLPGQNLLQSLSDLKQAIALQPGHLSWYQLTIEPNTVFAAKPPTLPVDDLIWDMQTEGQALLASHGYQQYEVSAYAQAQQRCEHNLNYWEFGDYLGIGAGAHGKITDTATGRIERFRRHRLPARYIELAGTEAALTHTETLSREAIPFEFMLNSMRLTGGIPANLFLERTGLPLSVIEPELSEAESRQLLDWQISRLAPTDHGQRYLNDLLGIFLK